MASFLQGLVALTVHVVRKQQVIRSFDDRVSVASADVINADKICTTFARISEGREHLHAEILKRPLSVEE
jgi:hypothetical protein